MSKQTAVSSGPAGEGRRKKRRRKDVSDRPVLEPNAAGIDIGARELYVAVAPERDNNPVQIFGTFTHDLHRLVDWLG